MPTQGSHKGNIVRLYTDMAGGGQNYVEVDLQEDLTLDINGNTIDASVKGTNDWGSILTGTKDYTWTLTAHVRHDGSNSVGEFFDALVADTLVAWEIATTVAGDLRFYGTVMIGNISMSFGKNDVSRYTITGNGIGAVQKGTVS